MFTLPILPPELRIPLGPYTIEGKDGAREPVFNYAGCTAVVRPVSLDEDAIWRDRYPAVLRDVVQPDGTTKKESRRSLEAVNALVKQQLIGIEGYGYQFEDGRTEAFDPKNDAHVQSMPGELRWAIYFRLRERAELQETTSGNSDSPSGSGGTKTSESSPAGDATAEPAIG